ncbi:hypothetical protein ABZ770_06575 [Streptomyces sp. NPDC006654]|uniref:hypothetical protein n=1 Tax=unclassified Streptomyces TaxID=2593676 RepID=UPI0033F12604
MHRSEVRSLMCQFKTENGQDAIWLAIAFRRLTPMHLDPVFCDEGHTFDVRLLAGTTEADLTDLVNAVG